MTTRLFLSLRTSLLHKEIQRSLLLDFQPYQMMKVLIVSDIHANWTALRTVLAAEQDYDNILCLGDLVDYGPQPFECVGWAVAKFQEGGWFLQGNHDWSVAHNADARCSIHYARLAEATRKFTRRVLGHRAMAFLSELPLRLELSLDGKRCVACHGTPRDPLFRYFNYNDPVEERLEVGSAGDPDCLFLGHTHVPCDIRSGLTHIINPGSIGQPRDDNPDAAYAVWENGQIHFRRSGYDTEEIAFAFISTGLHQRDVRALMAVLRVWRALARKAQLKLGRTNVQLRASPIRHTDCRVAAPRPLSRAMTSTSPASP